MRQLLGRLLAAVAPRSSGFSPSYRHGPALLEELDDRSPLDHIFGVGLFTLALMRDIAAGGGPLIQQYVQVSPAPVAAANLCHFLRNGTPPANRHLFDKLYDEALARLLDGQRLQTSFRC